MQSMCHGCNAVCTACEQVHAGSSGVQGRVWTGACSALHRCLQGSAGYASPGQGFTRKGRCAGWTVMCSAYGQQRCCTVRTAVLGCTGRGVHHVASQCEDCLAVRRTIPLGKTRPHPHVHSQERDLGRHCQRGLLRLFSEWWCGEAQNGGPP